ncbi:MAG: ATP-dependent helicase [Candidatus Sericytochromatia bacterium]
MTETLTLRPAQAEILAYTAGTMAISAVPGAGKTFVLTQLAAELIDQQAVKPSQILILTYMRSAATTFKRRIAQALKARGRTAYGLTASTIHSFCLQVVRQARAADEIEAPLDVLSDGERHRVLMDALERFIAEPHAFQDWRKRYGTKDGDEWNDPRQLTYKAADKVLSAVKNFNLSPSQVEEALGAHQPELAFMVRYYQEQLEALGLVDYDDLVRQAIDYLEADPALLAFYHRRFRYVFEDEAQDSTPAQNRLIRLLTDPSLGGAGNLVRVGDANQAIMTSFTFNDPRYFRAFCAEQERQGRHVAMDESSRSASPILEVANRLVAFVSGRPDDAALASAFHPLPIRLATAGKRNPEATSRPTFTVWANKEAEQLGVLVSVRDYLRRHPDHRCAILTFSNPQGHALRDKARQMGIALYDEDRRTGATASTLDLLEKTLQVLALPEGRLSETFLAVLEARQKAEREPWADLKAVRAMVKGSDLEGLFYPETGLPPHRPPGLASSDYAAVLLAADALRMLLSARHLPPAELLPTIAHALLADPVAPAIAAKAAVVAARHALTPDDPLLGLALELQKLQTASQGRELIANAGDLAPPEPGQLEILTLHRSKGAEYDAVWLPSLGHYYGTKTFFPWFLDQVDIHDRQAFMAEQALIHHEDPDPPSLAEAELESKRLIVAERLRLLYVGITRAERELHLSCYGQDPDTAAPPHVLDLARLCERKLP